MELPLEWRNYTSFYFKHCPAGIAETNMLTVWDNPWWTSVGNTESLQDDLELWFSVCKNKIQGGLCWWMAYMADLSTHFLLIQPDDRRLNEISTIKNQHFLRENWLLKKTKKKKEKKEKSRKKMEVVCQQHNSITTQICLSWEVSRKARDKLGQCKSHLGLCGEGYSGCLVYASWFLCSFPLAPS